MKYYLIAGEASGDLHGANLIKALQELDPTADIRFWGGDKMRATGSTQVKHYKETAFMGFAEVIKHLPTILRLLRECKFDIESFQPDALILIDYPGFNMRIAKWAYDQWPVFYYIAPQVWAWKSNRTLKLKATTNRLYSILPFEKTFFQKFDFDIEYVGHPLLDEIKSFTEKLELIRSKPNDRQLVVLLPGSRKQEIEKNLPLLIDLIDNNPNKRFAIAAVSSVDPIVYTNHLKDHSVDLQFDSTYELLANADAAIVASGTATLETALFDIPQMVIYKGNPFSVWLGRRLIKVSYISLVNIVLDQPLVREFVQKDASLANIQAELDAMLAEDRATELKKGYALLRERLQSTESPSDLVAKDILKHLRQ